jgi:hypothetical protein
MSYLGLASKTLFILRSERAEKERSDAVGDRGDRVASNAEAAA